VNKVSKIDELTENSKSIEQLTWNSKDYFFFLTAFFLAAFLTGLFFTAFLRVNGTSSEILNVATKASRTAASLRSEAIVLFRARLVAAAFLTGFLRRTTFFLVAIVVRTIPAIDAKPKIVGSPA
jgi:hypothetical protein